MKFGILVINLDCSPERLARTAAQLNALNLAWERLPAVDGRSAGASFAADAYSPELNRHQFKRTLSLGEIGCFLSHRRAWQRILDAGWDGAIILEDDVILSKEFSEIPAILAATAGHWEAVKLWTKRQNYLLFNKIKPADNPRWHLADYFEIPSGTVAQAITATAAAKLLATTSAFGVPVDTALQRYWKTGVSFKALLPLAVSLSPEFNSDIVTVGGNRGDLQKYPRRRFAPFLYKCGYNASACYHAIRKHGTATVLKTCLRMEV
ncbi:MAG: glycosyltransferase family 25 protein [Puniceicoccales bacterium]|jgi:glycosyl transferase family 25|nr:glycosyltransferase family 25 protein [Puniceicoccales bacterium]